MNRFEQAEELGRYTFMKNVYPQFKLEGEVSFGEQFTVYDIMYKDSKMIVLFEVKNRNVGSDEYTSIMLEDDKYQRLQEIAKQMSELHKLPVHIIYASLYNNNVCRLVTLNDTVLRRVECEVKSLVRYTSENGGYKNKKIYYLPNTISKVYSYNNTLIG